MAIKTAEKDINDKELKIILVGALDGIKITTQLSKVAIPVFASIAESKDKPDVTSLVSFVLQNIEEIDLDNLIKKLFNGATIDEFPINPDVYFAGNYGELVDFLAFALEANFGSFFDASILKSQPSATTKKRKA